MIEMPPISINNIIQHLTENEYILVQKIIYQGRLKATRPNVKYKYVEKYSVRVKQPEYDSACVAYLWAKIAYNISPYKRDLACPPDYRMYFTNKKDAVRLDVIANLICENTPKKYHYGLIARGLN